LRELDEMKIARHSG